MQPTPLLVRLIDFCRRNALVVVAAAILSGSFALAYTARHLALSSETDLLFSPDLPWRQRAAAFKADFPQFQDLLVAVIDAREPEEAEATAAALEQALSADPAHFQTVRRPDAAPFLRRAGMLFLERDRLATTIERIIEAQPFLGELAQDPSARGLFAALGRLGEGVARQHVNLTAYQDALAAFHDAIAAALAGRPRPLSWTRLLAGDIAADQPYRFVLAKPRLDHAEIEPGGGARHAMREAADGLEFVRSGTARVRITGNVALADEEFATVAQGAVLGLVASTVLIALWLFLAVRTWRLIVPILATLALGLVLTLLFAAVFVGTLNLISVGFGILFVGLAVDFAIQFCVRYRKIFRLSPDIAAAMTETGRQAGGQILLAATATAAGFLSFVPTDFRGVAELGLIAGAGMLIAFCCTMTFLPALVALCRPPRAGRQTGYRWAARLDEPVRRNRKPLLVLFGCLGCLGLVLLPRLVFDANPLNTKDPTTEAMRTLEDLRESPFANPFTAEIMAFDAAAAALLSARLENLPLVGKTLSINSFVPSGQPEKLALIGDARDLLGLALEPRPVPPRPQPEEIRAAARTALGRIEPALAASPSGEPADPALAVLAGDLRRLVMADDTVLHDADRSLTRFLPMLMDRLRDALAAEPVTLESIPPELARDWVLPDGRARVQIVPKPEARSSTGLAAFVADIAAVAPGATGPAPTIVATSGTIVAAFRSAAIAALAAITAILFLALRRALDVALVLAPLLLGALMSVIAMVLLPLPLNYANIIALPLLLGVGVSFNIYFVMNWRAGRREVLGSATARAVLFSALTTATAFGSLALSRHPGTASMGLLLLISLGFALLASLTFLPALLAAVPRGTAAEAAACSTESRPV